MANKEDIKTRLLLWREEGYDDSDLDTHQSKNKKSFKGLVVRFRPWIVTFAFALTIVSNSILLVAYHSAKSQIYLCPSEYTGIGLTTRGTYWQRTEYTDPDRNVSDALWEAIDTSPNTISLDRDYVKQHDLAESIPFPWDQSKGLYIVKAFHHMHCLKNIRRAYNEALASHPGQHQLIPSEHVYHCLDILRQDIMCRPDDTPMPTVQERHKIGDGQERRCKDWNALVRWTQEPSREACFKMIDDYQRLHTLEQFAFCSEDSHHKSTMEAYFREHGHKPLYLSEEGQEDTDEY